MKRREYGHGPARVNLTARHAMLTSVGHSRRFKVEPGYPPRNPHMRGTTSLLRLLVGSGLGSDFEGEHIPLNGERTHIFEMFALVDFLLCSAVSSAHQAQHAGGRGRSTAVMRRNCAEHFRRAIEILEPTILVAQGHGVRRWMAAVIDSSRPADARHPLELVRVGAVHALLATFVHPSAPSRYGWGANASQPYLRDVVRPTIAALLANEIDPPALNSRPVPVDP